MELDRTHSVSAVASLAACALIGVVGSAQSALAVGRGVSQAGMPASTVSAPEATTPTLPRPLAPRRPRPDRGGRGAIVTVDESAGRLSTMRDYVAAGASEQVDGSGSSNGLRLAAVDDVLARRASASSHDPARGPPLG